MINKILLVTIVFEINYILGNINNVKDDLADTSTVTEYSDNNLATNLSDNTSSDDTLSDQEEYLTEYPFSTDISPLTNYAILQKWLINNNVLTYCSQKKWDNLEKLIKKTYNICAKYGISYESLITCIASLCWEENQDSYDEFCKRYCTGVTNA